MAAHGIPYAAQTTFMTNRKDLSYKPKNKLPVEEYLKLQGRFAPMFKPGNEWMIEQVQKEVDRNWEELLKLCEL